MERNYNKLQKCQSQVCKADKQMFVSISVNHVANDVWYMQCNICKAQTSMVQGHNKAISEWNKGNMA